MYKYRSIRRVEVYLFFNNAPDCHTMTVKNSRVLIFYMQG